MTGEELRRIVLEVVRTHAGIDGALTQEVVLENAAQRLKIHGHPALEQALLSFWHDLFRTGYLAWGKDLANPGSPWCHLTEQGRNALKNISRDPANPDGYLNHLEATVALGVVAESYIREALRTFNAQCFKAAAVMVGAACEDLALGLRDELIRRRHALRKGVSPDLSDWRTKRVLDAIEAEIQGQKGTLPKDLFERFDSYWPAFTEQIRTIRNDAGHPKSIDPVQAENVHAALLVFPLLAVMAEDLRQWVLTHYR